MRYSKEHVILIPFILSIMIALAGCAQEEASGGVTDVTDALFLSGNEEGATAEAEGSSARGCFPSAGWTGTRKDFF